MNTKPVLFFLSFFLFACFISTSTMADAPDNDERATLTEQEAIAKIDMLTERVEELKVAKKHATTKVEKQQIRHEIRDIKKEAKALKQQVSGGVYIGTGVLLVALLLILLL